MQLRAIIRGEEGYTSIVNGVVMGIVFFLSMLFLAFWLFLGWIAAVALLVVLAGLITAGVLYCRHEEKKEREKRKPEKLPLKPEENKTRTEVSINEQNLKPLLYAGNTNSANNKNVNDNFVP